jgi:hypothetical protein
MNDGAYHLSFSPYRRYDLYTDYMGQMSCLRPPNSLTDCFICIILSKRQNFKPTLTWYLHVSICTMLLVGNGAWHAV